MMSSPKSWWMLSVGVFVCLWTQGARADSCAQSSDCPKGYMCHEYQSGACAGAPPCSEGQKCPAPPPCEVVTEHECAPADCNSDADCADFMVCYASTISECSGGSAVPAVDCPPNQTCSAPAPTPMAGACTEKTLKQCTPRYLLPCTAAADCGAGFTCEASEECSCSGSAGRDDAKRAPTPEASTDAGSSSSGAFAPAQDAGVATDLVATKDSGTPECECHASALKYCRVKEVTCKADTDCPNNFACITYASSGSAGCAVPRGSDGGACEPVETTTVEEKRCEPKYGGGSFGGADNAGAPTPGVAMGIPIKEGGSTTAGPVPSTDPRHSDDGALSADAGTTDPSSDKATCSVRAPGAHGSERAATGYALGFVLLALSLRRRRQH